MPRGLLIQPNGDYEFREINVGLGSDDVRNAVGGNFDWADTTDVSMYCYEYALFEQPVNPLASVLYWKDADRNGREIMRTTSGSPMPLAGPTLVLGPVKGEMETDVPDWAVEFFQKAHEKAQTDPNISGLSTTILDPAEIPGPRFVPEPNAPSPLGYPGGLFAASAPAGDREVPWEGSRRTGTPKL